MESLKACQGNTMNEHDNTSTGFKQKSQSNGGPNDQDSQESVTEAKLPCVGQPENGLTYNGMKQVENMEVTCERDTCEDEQNLSGSAVSGFSDTDLSEHVNGISVRDTTNVASSADVSHNMLKSRKDSGGGDGVTRNKSSSKACQSAGVDSVTSSPEFTDEIGGDKNSHDCSVATQVKTEMNSSEDENKDCDNDNKKDAVNKADDGKTRVHETLKMETFIKDEAAEDGSTECLPVDKKVKNENIAEGNTENDVTEVSIDDCDGGVNGNHDKNGKGKAENRDVSGQNVHADRECLDSSTDDIVIIGETRLAQMNKPLKTSQKVLTAPGGPPFAKDYKMPCASQQASSSKQNVFSQALSSPGLGGQALPAPFKPGNFPFQGSRNPPVFTPIVAPPKPKSSLDQIELIRWEIQNRINTRPKYFKPNPTAELGPLAKFLFDIGLDLIKEAVYHDLVKIQSKKNDNDKLTEKEKEDLFKLKEIKRDLTATIGHLKLKLKKRCNLCNFQTESHNVMFYHKQFPHEDNKFLRCSHCPFATRQMMAFKFHMEAEHATQARLSDKKALFECDLCPYENNQEQKLNLHKQRCLKQFRPLFNLHPSCLSGAEINLCLENIFYRTLIPKNLKLLQEKHAMQQAALAEARKKQAELQTVAAQKKATAAAAAAKKQQEVFQKTVAMAPRYNIPPSGRMPRPPVVPIQQPRLQSVRNSASARVTRPSIANMLHSKQNSIPAATSANTEGLEVCEICNGYVKDRKALGIHFFYAHRIDLPLNLFERTQAPLYCATCYVRFWTAQGLRKHIDTHKEENQTRGVVGKCILCGHHVLNLLLHMRVIHSREIQHYVNALMCMFCGAHFGSRQECEKHIINVHGHVDTATGTVKPAINAQQPQRQQTSTHHQQPQRQQTSTHLQHPQKMPPASQKVSGNSTLVKGSVCVLCNLNFGRNVDLTRHCMRMHHTCMKCGMVVIDKASLMKHTCLSSPNGTRDCSLCGETGFHPAYYVKHLRDKHLRKFSVQLRRLSRKTIEQWTKYPCQLEEPEDILVEISDSDDDVVAVSEPEPETAVGTNGKIDRQSEHKPDTLTVEVGQTDSHEHVIGSSVNVMKDLNTTIEISSSGSMVGLDATKEISNNCDTSDCPATKEMNSDDEVIDLNTTKEISSADENSRSSESSHGKKRKSASPGCEKSSKKMKLT